MLRLMLDGMEYAVSYWEDRDKEESDIEQTNVEAVKTAIETMRKYQKIEGIVKAWNDMNSFDSMEQISEVLEDGNDN